MGGLCNRFKKNKQLEQNSHEGQELIQQEEQKIKSQRPIPKKPPHQKGQLIFKPKNPIFKNQLNNIPIAKSMFQSEEWIINDQILRDLRDFNVLDIIDKSPARALMITLSSTTTKLICQSPMNVRQKQYSLYLEQPNLFKQQIYKDLFKIEFICLRKIKINAQKQGQGQGLRSMESLARLNCPFLQELTANGHPITNASFLRRCHWPYLAKLSLLGNIIADSYSLGVVMAGLSNSCHIEGLDIRGIHSANWTNVSWILKMGYDDAQTQRNRMEEDFQYYNRYFDQNLCRVDCNISQNKLCRKNIKMIYRKFNNKNIDNPLALW